MLVDSSTKRQIDHPAPAIYCDSQSTIDLIQDPVYHAKTKHIEIRFRHIRELVTKKKLKVRKINTEVNIVDCVMKPLPEQRFGTLRTMMGLRKVTEPNSEVKNTREQRAQ